MKSVQGEQLSRVNRSQAESFTFSVCTVFSVNEFQCEQFSGVNSFQG